MINKTDCDELVFGLNSKTSLKPKKFQRINRLIFIFTKTRKMLLALEPNKNIFL